MTNEDILLKIESDKKRQSFRNVAKASPKSIGTISAISYTKGGFGQLYDKTWDGSYEMKFKNYLGVEGNEDRLAKEQSAWEQVGNGLWKNLQKAGLYALDGVNTFTYGLYSAINDGDIKSLWNTDVSKYLDLASKRLDRDFANYYTDEEKSKGFFGRMFTNPANFLANDVAGGLAFVAGAVLPELAIGVLTGGASLPASFAKMGARVGLKKAFKASADNVAQSAIREGVEQSAKKLTKEATRKEAMSGLRALNWANSGKKVGDVLNTARFIGQSTFFEAGMEARHNFHDSVDGFMESFQQREGRLPSQEELTEYIGEASKAADFVFGANVALLSVTNAAMFGKLFKLPPLNLETKIGKAFGIDVMKLPTGKLAITNATKAQKALGNTYFLARKPFSEGIVEEGMQGVFGHTMNNYLDSKYDPNQPDMTLMNAFGEALNQQYTTKEGWFEIGIGAIIGMIGGNVSGNFGVEGIGKSGYSGARKGLEQKVNTYNESTEKALRGLIRTNSVATFDASKTTGLEATPAFHDTLVNYNYIKANSPLKGYVDTISEFNTVVDNTVVSEEDMKTFGFTSEEQLTEYKQSLKDNFKRDYNLYEEVSTIVDNLAVPNLTIGDMAEFKDSVSFSLMAGKKAGIESEKIASKIAEIVGVDGVYDALKFQSEMDDMYDEKIQTFKEKQSRQEELKNEILNVGQKLEELKDNEQAYKENSKKYVVLTREMKKVTDELTAIEDVMTKDFEAIQANITFTPKEMSITSIRDVVSKIDSVSEYVSSLERTGRVKEAKTIKTLLEQFRAYSSAEINSVNAVRRMYETNFYSSKEGKGMLSSIKGEGYSMSEQAKKEIEDNEELVRDILVRNGFEFTNTSETVEKLLQENSNLSEKEKFKMESMLRSMLAHQRIQDMVQEQVEEQAQIEDEVVKGEEFAQEGDTIFISKRLEGEDLNNPETINQLIKDITNEIDLIVNKPTAENLRGIKSKEKEIEQLKKQIDAIQKQSTAEISMGEQATDSGEVFQGDTQGQETTQQSKEAEEALIQSLQKDLEFEIGSEFGSPEMAQKIKEQLDNLTKEDIDEVINEIENENDTTRPNASNIRKEAISDTNGESRENATVETNEVVKTTDTGFDDRKKQVEEITQSIQKLEEEINDLKTPFKFMESEGYTRYNKLLSKKITNELSPEEEDESSNLESSINQWITITGVRVQGIELSDLIKQLQVLDNLTPIVEQAPVIEIQDEDIIEDAKQTEESTRNNYEVGLSYNGVFSRKTKDATIISNISLDAFEEATGLSLRDREGVTLTATNGIRLTHEIAEEINNVGLVRIFNPAFDETTTYYSLVMQSTSDMVTGETVLTPMTSDYDTDYEEGLIDPEDIFNTSTGDSVSFKLDPNHPRNKELLNRLREEMGVTKPLSDGELKEEVNKIVQDKSAKNATIKKIQEEITQFQGKELTTTTTARLNLLEKRLKDQLRDLRVKAEEEVLNRKEKKPKKPSPELMDEIVKNFRIMAIDEKEGNNLQILKGIRTAEGYEGSNPHFEALRSNLTSDPQILLDLLESNNYEVYDMPVKVLKVFLGHPQYNYVVDQETNKISRRHKPIIKENLSKIADIGFVENGELKLKGKKVDKVNKDYIKSAIKRGGKGKTPVVVIQQGKHLIAYPVKVGRRESPIDLNSFRSVFESESMSAVDKALRLNTILSQAGVDVKQKGKAFVVLGDNMLNSEFFEKMFGELQNKEYLRGVDDWVDSKKSIEQSLVTDGTVTINIDMTKPFISPKIKFDLTAIPVKKSSSSKKKATKKAVLTDDRTSVLKNFRCKK